ncbi:MAG: outer membrane protein [Kiritimatiellia bacterium]|jgi:outer membrane protein
MKKIPLYLFVLLFCGNVFAHATIGVLNFNEALFNTEAWKQQVEQLELTLSDDQSAADSLRQELLDLQETLQVNMPTLTRTEMQRIQEEAQFRQLKFQQIGERVQSTLQSSQNQFLERYRSLLGEALDEIYTEGGYDFILRSDSIAASGFTYNVTSEVTAKLNELIADLSAAAQ